MFKHDVRMKISHIWHFLRYLHFSMNKLKITVVEGPLYSKNTPLFSSQISGFFLLPIQNWTYLVVKTLILEVTSTEQVSNFLL